MSSKRAFLGFSSLILFSFFSPLGVADTSALERSLSHADYQKTRVLFAQQAYHKLSEAEVVLALDEALGPKVRLAVEEGKATSEHYASALDAILHRLNVKAARKGYENEESYEILWGRQREAFRERIQEKPIAGVGIKLVNYTSVGENSSPDTSLPQVEAVYLAETRFAGLRPGDFIAKVDGVDALELKHKDALIDKIRGPIGSSIVLTVMRGKDAPHDIKLTRRTMHIPSVTLSEVKNKTAVIAIQDFAPSSLEDMDSLISILKHFPVSSYVLDLRSNGGGSVDAAVNIMRFFAHRGDMLFQASSHEDGSLDPKSTLLAQEDGVLAGVPVVLMINRQTLGSAEQFAAYMQALGHPVVGEKTLGLGELKSVEKINEQLTFHFLRQQVALPDASLLANKGVIPDHSVDDNQAMLAAALKQLGKKR